MRKLIVLLFFALSVHAQVPTPEEFLGYKLGERFTTYAIPAPAGSGTIGINGAAARRAQKGDLVIIVAYARMQEAEAKSFTPRVVLVDGNNRPQAPSLRVLET